MPNYRADRARFVADRDTVLGRDAANKAERRQTLEDLLNNNWANADIGKLERIDNANDHGWELCPFKRDPS